MAGYEDLRRQALQEDRGHRGLGMVLLLRQGMVAWMKAWLESTHTVPEPPANAGTFVPVVADDSRSEVIVILAAMALSHWQELRA